MGLNLRFLKNIWEAVTPQDEGAMRAANATIADANRRIAAGGNQNKGVLGQPQRRQQFIQQQTPGTFNLRRELPRSFTETLTNPSKWNVDKVNVGNFFGSGVIEDFINSPFKVGRGAVKVGQGDIKQGLGDITTGLIEGPAGFIPITRTGQAVGKAKGLLPKVVKGAKTGLIEGGVSGGLYGGGQVAAQNGSTKDIIKGAGLGAVVGGGAGVVLGGGLPAVARGAQLAKANRTLLDNAGGVPIPKSKPKITEKMIREATKPGQEIIETSAPRPIISGKVKKTPIVKDVLSKLSRAKTASATEAGLTANIIRSKAKTEGVSLDRGFRDRYQSGTLKKGAEQRVGQIIKQETDRVFKQQQKLDPNIKYRQNYLPQAYAQSQDVVDEATKQLRTRTGAGKQRAFSTYQEAGEFGLSPKYETVDQMIGANAADARKALGNRTAVQSGLNSGLFTANPATAKGLSAVDGFYDKYGNQVFASKKVADVVNGVMQDSTTGLSKTLKGSAELNGVWQDIALAGGVPGTPLNFFTFGQMFKDLAAGRVSVVKDLLYSMSDNATAKRFASKDKFVREMANRGLPLSQLSSLTNVDRNALSTIWGRAVNQPTFQRFMPNQYLTLSENVFSKAQKKLGRDAALDLAAETTKKFYGIVDQIAKGRDNTTQSAISSLFFAPRYRESIINTLFNTGKSVTTKIADPAYAMNRRLFAGLAVTAAGYEILNRQITGHSMFDNREGQELSLEIPYGEKDKGGNQPVLNIPFMPGFLALPRAAVNAIKSLSEGDAKGFMAEGGKTLSMPITTATTLIGNKNYFGEPIYISDEVAKKEGVEADSPLGVVKKIGSYLAGQSTPAWVRAGIAQAQGKPLGKVLATGLEAPVRFGKRPNPDTAAYFEEKDNAYNKLNTNQKAVFDTVFPDKKNILNQDIKDTNPNDRITKASTLKGNPEVFRAVADMYRAIENRTGQSTDPLYGLDWNKAQNVLWARSLAPGESSDTKGELLYDQPWYPDFKKKENAYYTSLEKKFGKKDDPYNYPDETSQIDKLQGIYFKLPKGTGARSDFLEANPALTGYWDKRRGAVNRHRIALGLPPIEDEFNAFASGSGSRGRGRGGRGSAGKKNAGSAYKYAINTGVDVPGSKVAGAKIVKLKQPTVASAGGKPKVTIKKSLV